MVNNDILIINKETNYRAFLRLVTVFKPKKSQPAIVVPLINLSSKNTVLFRFMGPSETVTLNFVLIDDGTDIADGSYTSTVVTVQEQFEYLKDVIFTENYDVDFTLADLRNVAYPSGGKEIRGVITDLEFDFGSKAKVFVPGTLSFQRGNIGAL